MPLSIYSRHAGLDPIEVDGNVTLPQRLEPASEDHPDSLVHVVIAGDTLDLLAKTYYGREDLWWRIADANPSRFPLDWAPGDTLVIPPIRVATKTGRR
jgi:nucleoid-associated protein YgaU